MRGLLLVSRLFTVFVLAERVLVPFLPGDAFSGRRRGARDHPSRHGGPCYWSFLADKGLLVNDCRFLCLVFLSNNTAKLKAGEYSIPGA
jgi:hypothetical protein